MIGSFIIFAKAHKQDGLFSPVPIYYILPIPSHHHSFPDSSTYFNISLAHALYSFSPTKSIISSRIVVNLSLTGSCADTSFDSSVKFTVMDLFKLPLSGLMIVVFSFQKCSWMRSWICSTTASV